MDVVEWHPPAASSFSTHLPPAVGLKQQPGAPPSPREKGTDHVFLGVWKSPCSTESPSAPACSSALGSQPQIGCPACSAIAVPSSSRAQALIRPSIDPSTHPVPIHLVTVWPRRPRSGLPLSEARARKNSVCSAFKKTIDSSHLVLDGVVPAHGGHILRHGGLLLLSDGADRSWGLLLFFFGRGGS